MTKVDKNMTLYDTVEIEDMELNDGIYSFPCPCGDSFVISIDDMREGEDIAYCPSCSLYIQVVYDPESL